MLCPRSPWWCIVFVHVELHKSMSTNFDPNATILVWLLFSRDFFRPRHQNLVKDVVKAFRWVSWVRGRSVKSLSTP